MEYECREMNLNELEETMELVKKVFDEFEAPEYSDEGIKNFYKFANVENIKKLLNENLKIVIVKDYSKIIGMLAIRDNSHIGMLFVDKSYHRKGIAKYLIRYAKGLYRMNNTDITVNSSPYAVEIYKRMGFEILSNEKETDGIRFIPMVLKKYKLNNAKGELELVFPTEEYRDQIMDYLQEHFDNGEMILNGCGGLDRLKDFDSWLEKVRNDVDFAKCSEGRVPASLYMAIRKSDKRLIGLIQIRHCLNEKLLQTSGHIGDGVRPSERKKGYVTEMIRLALEKCKELGIKRVLMSCDKDNVGSRKSIMNNGGVLENEIKMEDESIEQRFWISLKKQSAHLNLKSLGNVEEKTIRVDEDDFKGYIHLNNFIKMNEKFLLPKGLCIRDTGYKWLEFYGENSNFKLTAIYDNLGRIVEWYFDLVRGIGRENGFPYDEDWYLDVVVTPDGDILLLDEDEYEEAYQRYEMTESEYKLGKDLVYDLMKRLENNVENLNNFTNKYLEKIESK
ncbi:MAG: GNAT family N-acetyltransferase [Clostridia bacterium]